MKSKKKKNWRLFSTEISLKRSQYGGTLFHHMLIHLLPATNKNLFQPLESKWGNISNNRRLWEQSIKHMISPNRPYSQGLKCSFSALVINTQIDQYLQSRVGYIYFFHSKMSGFWTLNFTEKFFASAKPLGHWIIFPVKTEKLSVWQHGKCR